MIASGALYIYSRIILTHEIEEELYSDKDRIERLLELDQNAKGIPPIISIQKVNDAENDRVSDTLIYDPLQDEIEPFRQLSGTKKIDGQFYKITVRAMAIESEDILFAIVLMFITIILLAFIFQFYLMKFKNKALWKPFFTNLDKLKTFSLQSNQPLEFEESDIVEFDELNKQISSLTNKVQGDYQNLKQFTENVSHEMQTPLAIMQAKIDTLINGENISIAQFEKFSSLQNDIKRLKQLNKRLILLAKIDNLQFQNSERINLPSIFSKNIANFKEITDAELIEKGNENLVVSMDVELASVLCSNLLSNALKYHEKNTPIRVCYHQDHIKIINSGTKALNQPMHIFDRYYKEGNHSGSSGLGLSIVKKICDFYGFQPSYTFQEAPISEEFGKHIFKIKFNKV